MKLFGFAINFISGRTEYVIVPALSETAAEVFILARCGGARLPVESITHYDAETIIEEQFDGLAVLTANLGED